MIKDQLIKQLRSRSEKVYSDGKILDYRLYGDRKHRSFLPPQQFESDALNPVQSFLYKRALKGLEVYTKKEIREMNKEEKHKIIKMYSRTQKELTLWKHKLTIAASDEILALLPNSMLARALVNYDCLDITTDNSFSFRDLGIKKTDIIQKLHEVGILPANFYDINKKTYENKTKSL